jgi:hypothetical protein
VNDPLGIIAIAEAQVLRQAAEVVKIRERPAASFEDLDQALDGLRQASRHLDRVKHEEQRAAKMVFDCGHPHATHEDAQRCWDLLDPTMRQHAQARP